MATVTIDPGDSIVDNVNAANSGDIIRLNDGTYNTERVYINGKNFASGNPVIVEAVNFGQATIEGDYTYPTGQFVSGTTSTYATHNDGNQTGLGYVWGGLLHFKNSSNITFQGINVKESRGRGVSVENSQNIRFTDGYVKNCRQSGIWIGGSTSVIIDTVEVNDCANFFPYSRGSSTINWPVIVNTTNGSRNVQIKNSWIHGNWGEGMGSGHEVANVFWLNNYVGPNFAMGVYMHFGFNVVMDSCVIYHDDSDTYNRGADPSSCVVFNRENRNFPSEGASGGHKMTNCLIISRSDAEGIALWANQGVGAPSGSIEIVNNTLISNAGPPLTSIGNIATTHTDTYIYNNIFYRVDGGDCYDDNNSGASPISGSTVKWRNNVWSKLPPTSMRGTGDQTGSPSMVSYVIAENVTAGTKPDPLNYRIQASSIANNNGTALAYPTEDFFGTSRPDTNIDIGFHHLEPAASGGPPVWDTLPTNQTLIEGQAVSGLSVTATDPDLDTITYSESGLPPGLSLNTSSGAITGTPTTEGSYPVVFGATDGTNAIQTAVSYAVNRSAASITAAFTYNITGSSVAFTDASTASGTTITSWYWDFGDGSTSASQNPTHVYSDTTIDYVVSLTVQDAHGGSNLVSNGDFESGTTSWGEFDATNTAFLTGGALGTTNGYRINSSGAGNTQIFQQGISISSGTSYTLVAYLKGNVSHGRIKVIQDNSPFNNLGLDITQALTEEWTRYQWTFVANASEADTRIQFAYFGANASAYIAVDEVEFFDATDIQITEMAVENITFESPVTPDIDFDTQTGDIPLTVTVSDASLYAEGVDVSTISVEWGDATSTAISRGEAGVQKVYTISGTYNVTLRITTVD